MRRLRRSWWRRQVALKTSHVKWWIDCTICGVPGVLTWASWLSSVLLGVCFELKVPWLECLFFNPILRAVFARFNGILEIVQIVLWLESCEIGIFIVNVECNCLTRFVVDILSLDILVHEGWCRDKVWLLEIDIKVGDTPRASTNKQSPYYQNWNNAWFWCNSNRELFVKKLLGSVGVLFDWDWVRFFSLIRIGFLLFSQASSFAANYGSLRAAACSAAISFLLWLSSKIPNHESWENSDTWEE